VTVVLLTCSYNGQEFIRVGYYVNNEYTDPALVENPPSCLLLDRMQRSILADQPRITRFPIDFDGCVDGMEMAEPAAGMDCGAGGDAQAAGFGQPAFGQENTMEADDVAGAQFDYGGGGAGAFSRGGFADTGIMA